MKRFAVLILLCLSLSWTLPSAGQIFRGPNSAKRAQKAARKDQKRAAKRQKKAMKRYAKAQRRALKRAKHGA